MEKHVYNMAKVFLLAGLFVLSSCLQQSDDGGDVVAVERLIPTGENINTWAAGDWNDLASDVEAPEIDTYVSTRALDDVIRLTFDEIPVSTYDATHLNVLLQISGVHGGLPPGITHEIRVNVYYDSVSIGTNLFQDIASYPNHGLVSFEVTNQHMDDTSKLWVEVISKPRGTVPSDGIYLYAVNVDATYINRLVKIIKVDSPIRQGR